MYIGYIADSGVIALHVNYGDIFPPGPCVWVELYLKEWKLILSENAVNVDYGFTWQGIVWLSDWDL
jgi:hypothetical protein